MPAEWSEGVEYRMAEGSDFERNELVVMTGTDGSLRFGVVMGCKDGECILEFGDPDARDQTPLFRMEKVEMVGKILADTSELSALPAKRPSRRVTAAVDWVVERFGRKDSKDLKGVSEGAKAQAEGRKPKRQVVRLRHGSSGVQQSRGSGVDGEGI